MNSHDEKIRSIKSQMNKDEKYSTIKANGVYTITFGANGRQITVTATPLLPVTADQIEDGDYPVNYTININKYDDFCTTDYDSMFDFVANLLA